MLPPEVIDKLRREKGDEDRPALRLPLYPPCVESPGGLSDEDEVTEASSVIVIDL